MGEWEVYGISGGAGGVLLYFFGQYLKGVNVNLKALLSPIEKLQKSISELNIKIAVVINDRANDKTRIDENTRDIKAIQAHCKSCTIRGN